MNGYLKKLKHKLRKESSIVLIRCRRNRAARRW